MKHSLLFIISLSASSLLAQSWNAANSSTTPSDKFTKTTPHL